MSGEAIDRARSLLERRPASVAERAAYLDLLGPDGLPSPGLPQRVMQSTPLPYIYERWWRPLGGRLAKGPTGPSMAGEHQIALQLLELSSGETVLDVACGPGNFTRLFGQAIGSGGLVIGFDASRPMLDRAVRDTDAANIAYVRGDATELPFRAETFDAVCCFAALNLMEQPIRALDEMVRVLAPGGRIALFTSCRRGEPLLDPLMALAGRLSGMTVFGREELTGMLRAHGLDATTQRVAGLTQFVGARRPPRPAASARRRQAARRPPRSGSR